MDKCSCKPGFIGDGVTLCNPSFPLPFSSNPSAGNVKGCFPVNISLHDNINTTVVFCRFGDSIVAGKILNLKTIMCIAPAGNCGKIELRVSGDPNNWNLPGIDFEYTDINNYSFVVYQFVAVLFVIVVVFLTFILLREKKAPEDLQPLIINMPQSDKMHSELSAHGFFPL
ncbi:hypothetical protein GPJ56_005678 [Histomonas meleagridis]|uniref:uncharacterized protein n=1 Tax=Histomonas meleagridis TaxID=135588 RepID=UPI00355A9639|nr:hypothetical protein GPJ56_005678 [Histomonas meleagridis]KAH0803387.1 hypothetical protein GO595_003731 [Histomonas meleagridis]